MSINKSFAVKKGCGESYPTLNYTVLNVSGDLGWSGSVGAYYGVKYSNYTKYGVKAGFTFDSKGISFVGTAYASTIGDFVVTFPLADVHFPYGDERSSGWEKELINW